MEDVQAVLKMPAAEFMKPLQPGARGFGGWEEGRGEGLLWSAQASLPSFAGSHTRDS